MIEGYVISCSTTKSSCYFGSLGGIMKKLVKVGLLALAIVATTFITVFTNNNLRSSILKNGAV